MFNFNCIYTWLYLQLFEKLHNHRKFVIRTTIGVHILRYTYTYTSGYKVSICLYVKLYVYLCMFIFI